MREMGGKRLIQEIKRAIMRVKKEEAKMESLNALIKSWVSQGLVDKIFTALITLVVGILVIKAVMRLLTRALEKSKLEKAAYSLILSLARVGLYLLLGLSLLVMLGVTIKERVSNPHLVTERPTAPQGMGQEQNLLASLMQKVAAEPTNKDALMHLAEHLMATQEWDAAATFAQRAVALDVNDPQPLYMLGVILHNQGKPQEAAATLEKVVALRDDATVRYSLGVLYSYFLQQKDKGRAHWEAGLKDPKISPEMRQAIEEELKK